MIKYVVTDCVDPLLVLFCFVPCLNLPVQCTPAPKFSKISLYLKQGSIHANMVYDWLL